MFIKRIPDANVRIGLSLLLNPIRGMIKVLSDEDPKNAQQVRDIWKKFTNTDLSDYRYADT